VARNRQRAKQRQAERRARRLAERGEQPTQPAVDESRAPERGGDGPGDAQQSDFLAVPGVTPGLSTGAPPEDLGRSDTVFEEDAPATEEEALEEIEDWEVGEEDHLTQEEIDAELEHEEELAGRGEEGFEVRGRRGREEAEKHRDRPRVIQFLIAVWAELQRVQWPNRQALITLTGVVLGFVLIAGGYLGLLDAIFSELIKAIL
jgi:preprotein translocase subunit SecE